MSNISGDLKISEYLTLMCEQLKNDLPDDVFTCEIYAGQLAEGATNGFSFTVKKGTQCYLTMDSLNFKLSDVLIGDARFSLYCAAAPSFETRGFSLEGLNAVQRITGYINNKNEFMDGLMGRPEFIGITQLENKEKNKRLYNVFRIDYRQKIILDQN